MYSLFILKYCDLEDYKILNNVVDNGGIDYVYRKR